MCTENKLLTNTAQRLSVYDPATIKKSEEFLRVSLNKGIIKFLNDIARTVICLDLAATFLGTPFDKDTALTLSGLKRPEYNRSLHILENVLELNKPPSISELCVQFSCTSIKDAAEEIWTSYRNREDKITDLLHPQYVAASVFTACKLKGVKVQNQQFVQVSRLKSSQWKELTAEFQKYAESLGVGKMKKGTKKDLQNVLDIDDVEMMEENGNKKEVIEDEVEEYEVWKKRILAEAYAAL